MKVTKFLENCLPLVLRPTASSALVHTVLLFRTVGDVAPYDVECEFFDLTYARCDRATMAKTVEQTASTFETFLFSTPQREAQVSSSERVSLLFG